MSAADPAPPQALEDPKARAIAEFRTSLAGVWRGPGKVLRGDAEGARPGTDVPYLEEVQFFSAPGSGKPWLRYVQHTKHAVAGHPMHTETGYWRLLDNGRAEIALAQPFGVTELLQGEVDCAQKRITVASTHIGRPESAKEPAVLAVRRVFWLENGGNTLAYNLFLGTSRNDGELQLHLEAKLHREEK